MGIVIAVDGQAAAGKGTLSRSLARLMGLAHLDTGALYRAVARAAMDRGVDPGDHAACTALAEEMDASWTLRGDLRGEAVGQVASKVSAIPGVRAALLDFQRRFAAEHPGAPNGAVLDGRDIGTVICPDADLKVFLVADAAARARRRHAEDPDAGDVAAIEASIRERDEREASRAVAPMRPSADALVIDTSDMTAWDVLGRVLQMWEHVADMHAAHAAR